MSPVSNAESNDIDDRSFDEGDYIDDRSFVDDEFEQRFGNCNVDDGDSQIHAMHAHANEEGHYDIDEDFDGSYIGDDGEQYYGDDYGDEEEGRAYAAGHVGAEEVQVYPLIVCD